MLGQGFGDEQPQSDLALTPTSGEGENNMLA